MRVLKDPLLIFLPAGTTRIRYVDFCDGGQSNRSFAGEDAEGERLLKIQPYERIGMAEVADRNVLPDVQFEVAASRG